MFFSGEFQVIPCMAFVIAYLGERLRKISKRAHLSIATLAAYLNEVGFMFIRPSVFHFHDCLQFIFYSFKFLGSTQVSKFKLLLILASPFIMFQVLPAILFVKANNGELSEHARFERLAYANLSQHLAKKKMKALIPQIIQIIYFGVLCILCIGSLVVSRGSFDGCNMVSFVTSLLFLVEPIQVILFFQKSLPCLFLL